MYTKRAEYVTINSYVHKKVHIEKSKWRDIMGNIHVRDVDEQILFKLKTSAKEQQVSLSELVREILGKYVEDGMLSSSVTKFERAIKETQVSLDANTDAYNQFINDNQRFINFMIDMITKEDFLTDEDNNYVD